RVRDAMGLPAAAAEGYRAVADHRERALGPAAGRTLRARNEQAGALLAAEQPAQAKQVLERALAHADGLAGDDPLRIRLQLNHAEAVSSLGDRRAARKALESLLERSLAARGERDPAVMEVENNLAMLLGRMGEPELGRDYLERMVPIRREVLGDNDAKTLESLHNLAVMRVMTGDKPGALAMQRQLVETQTRRLGAEHPKTLSERGNLASMLIDSGKAEQALPISTAV